MSTLKSSAEDLTLNADGSGNDIILQSNGSNVGTLTAEGVLTATSFAGSGASLTGLTSSQMPAGSVIQVVSMVTNTATTTTSTSFVDTAVTLNITPSNASNKILVIANLTGIVAEDNLSALSMQIVRDSTSIYTNLNFLYGTTSALIANFDMVTLDSPSTTSATTYKVQIKNRESNNITIGTNSIDDCSITLMEIVG